MEANEADAVGRAAIADLEKLEREVRRLVTRRAQGLFTLVVIFFSGFSA